MVPTEPEEKWRYSSRDKSRARVIAQHPQCFASCGVGFVETNEVPPILPDPDAPLAGAEFDALVKLSRGADPHAIPLEFRQKLIKFGFVKKVGVEFLITSAGRLRLMRGG